MYHGPFVRVGRALTPALREERDALAVRFGAPIARDVALRDVAFDPVGAPDRIAEVCMVVRRPSGRLLLAIKDFYPRGAFRLPTGGIHRGETIEGALRREAHEETGLRLRPRRFLAALTYRHGVGGPVVFHTFAFLLHETGGHLASQDPGERIERWREIDPGDLAAVARALERIRDDAGDEIPNWSAWGRFRAHVHRAVAEALDVPAAPLSSRTGKGGSRARTR